MQAQTNYGRGQQTAYYLAMSKIYLTKDVAQFKSTIKKKRKKAWFRLMCSVGQRGQVDVEEVVNFLLGLQWPLMQKSCCVCVRLCGYGGVLLYLCVTFGFNRKSLNWNPTPDVATLAVCNGCAMRMSLGLSAVLGKPYWYKDAPLPQR